MSLTRHFGQRAEWILGRTSGFIKVGRHRFVWRVVDDEPWRDEDCPGCGHRFTEDPRFTCSFDRIHMECEFAGLHQHYDEDGQPIPKCRLCGGTTWMPTGEPCAECHTFAVSDRSATPGEGPELAGEGE